MPTFMPHNAAHERSQASTLVTIILDRGYSVSVNDGEETVLKRSRDKGAILDAMGSTDNDTLTVRDNDGNHIGYFWLIYGNGPGELVADHSIDAAGYMESIWNAWSAKHPV